MALCAARGDKKIITAYDFELAIDLLEKTEQVMPLVYAGYGRLDVSDIMHKIMQLIAHHKAVKVSTLVERFHMHVTVEQIQGIVEALRRMQWCTVKLDVKTGDSELMYIAKEGRENEEES